MTWKSLLIAPAAVLALGVGTALAAPGGGVKDLGVADGGLVHKTHGCHRSCELGPAGWHRHGAFCVRIACVPRAWHPHRCYVGRWGVRHCRW